MTKKNSSWFIVAATTVLTSTIATGFTSIGAHAVHAQKVDGTASKTEEVEAKTARQFWIEALVAERRSDFKQAVAKADKAIGAGLKLDRAYYVRGCWNFCIGEINASLKDFDQFVELVPSESNSQWQRGITCYYAGKYKAGAKQFADYQNYHDNDVENAVWRYLCQVKFDSKDKARKAILPIKNDRRIPMMAIYRLFRGEATPEQVLLETDSSKATGELAKNEAFDAHLYLALYFDSEGDLDRAKKYIDLAVKHKKPADYMWAVAVEHQRLVARKLKEKMARQKK